MRLAFNVQQQMPRSFKRTLGEKITVHCTDMLDLMAMANATQGANRVVHIRELLKLQHTTTVLLRVCHDMRFISPKVWADSVQLLGTIGKRTLATAVSRLRTMPAADVFTAGNSYLGLIGQASHAHTDRATLANVLLRRGHAVKSDFSKIYRRHTP